MEAELAAAGGAVDLSMWGLIWRADPVVKVVMVILVIASLWSWAIIFDKLLTVRRMSSRARAFEDTFWSGGAMDELFHRIDGKENHPMASIFAAGMREWLKSKEQGGAGKKEGEASRGLEGAPDRAQDVTGQHGQTLEMTSKDDTGVDLRFGGAGAKQPVQRQGNWRGKR